MHRSESGWIQAYQDQDALWLHDNNRKRPHALLSAGDHSNGFFNSGLVVKNPELLYEGAEDVAELLQEAGASVFDISMVCGPAMGAITWAHEIARAISCDTAYAVKKEDATKRWMEFDRIGPEPDSIVLPAEDVITTGASVELMIDAIEKRGARTLPFIAAIVNRSGLTQVRGHKIVALINLAIDQWKPDNCPLCNIGSVAIKPKAEGNWTRLNGTY